MVTAGMGLLLGPLISHDVISRPGKRNSELLGHDVSSASLRSWGHGTAIHNGRNGRKSAVVCLLHSENEQDSHHFGARGRTP
jgi:hypothetical protein